MIRRIGVSGSGALFRCLVSLFVFMALPLWAQPAMRPVAPPVTVLDANQPLIDLQQASVALIDPAGDLTIVQVADSARSVQTDGNRPAMSLSQADTTYTLGEKGALWQHYRFQLSPTDQTGWLLEFPLPLLDKVTVFQRNADGQWQEESAGDTLSVSSWPEPARYPQFQLKADASTVARPDGVRDVYVRLQHVMPVNIPVNAVTERVQARRQQSQLLLLGVVFGVMAFLVISCSVQSRVYRDAAYGWYAAYTAVMLMVLLAWTGIGGQLLWPDSGHWNDLSTGCLALLSTSTWPMLVRHLCRQPSQHAWQRALNALALFTSVAGLPLAIAYLFLPRATGVTLLGAELVLVSLVTMACALQSYRRQDAAGGWVLVAVTPLTAATLLTVGNLIGLLPTSWVAQNAMTLALCVQVPLLLMALHLRSRSRHEVEMRARTIISQDALTGLLVRPIFDDRLHQTLLRAQHREETAAIVFIELANYAYVKKTWGLAVAEQSVLRSVIKLRRLLRDVNTVGRLDEARFGVILEGVSSRAVVNDLASRLIASGLMPLKGLKPDVVLQFHVTSALLSEHPLPGPDLSQQLTELLERMSARTRRPIRFLKGVSALPDDASNEPAWAVTDAHADLSPQVPHDPPNRDAAQAQNT
jgi:two-component system, sensor histidine kinase LadS